MKYALLIWALFSSFLVIHYISDKQAYKATSLLLPKEIPKTGIVVVEYGSQWCEGCKEIRPYLEEKQKLLKYKFVYVDSDKDVIFNKIFYVISIPTVFIFNNGLIFYSGPWPGTSDFTRAMFKLNGYTEE